MAVEATRYRSDGKESVSVGPMDNALHLWNMKISQIFEKMKICEETIRVQNEELQELVSSSETVGRKIKAFSKLAAKHRATPVSALLFLSDTSIKIATLENEQNKLNKKIESISEEIMRQGEAFNEHEKQYASMQETSHRILFAYTEQASALDLNGLGLLSFPVDALKHLPSLQQLTVSNNRLATLPPLSNNLKGLTSLDVSGNSIERIKLSSLPSTLRKLHLTGNPVCEDVQTRIALQKSLPNCEVFY